MDAHWIKRNHHDNNVSTRTHHDTHYHFTTTTTPSSGLRPFIDSTNTTSTHSGLEALRTETQEPKYKH